MKPSEKLLMRVFIFILTTAIILSCISSFAQSTDNFGLSKRKAVITDARTAQDGIMFEHKWIERNYPHSDIVDFRMEGAGKYKNGIPSQLFDIYLIRTTKKKKLKIYFMVMYYHGHI